MNIDVQGLGYRELGRIADFIRVIENGKKEFQDLVDLYDEVVISYDLHADSVTIQGFHYHEVDWDTIITTGPTLYPEDLDIDV